MKNVGKISCGHSYGVSKIFRPPIYSVHRAIVQLACYAITLMIQ